MEFKPSEEAEFVSERWTGIERIDDKHYSFGQDYYFDSYAHYGIHEDMIKDSVRTGAYKKAILRNKYLFANKVVLDVGCGTGILSFFAVQAGAAKVYAVDFSDIIEYARQIGSENDFDGKVVFIRGKIEEVDIPEPVDIIISEWMGYLLLYESMLESVLFARDKWLKEDGMLFPDKARIWLAAIEDADFMARKIEFWNDVYGVNMEQMRSQAIREPLVDVVGHSPIVTSLCPVADINLQTVQVEELEFTSTYRLHVTRRDIAHGLVGWFEVGFFHCHKPVILSTSPRLVKTHWKHVVFYFDEPVEVEAGDMLEGSFALRKNPEQKRELDIKISYHLGNKSGVQFYRLR